MIRLLLTSFFALIFFAVVAAADENSFGGVGLQVVPTINGNLVVLNVLAGAPAADKGLQPGDLIFQVNDYSLKGSEFGRVVSEYLWGPIGSFVVLHYRRPGVSGDLQVELIRTSINPRLTVTPTVQGGAGKREEAVR